LRRRPLALLLFAACASQQLRPGAVVVVRAERPAALDGTAERVLAVADDGSRRVLLTDQAAWVLRGGSAERTPGAHRWTRAALIPAADGRGTWGVGVDDQGRLLRVRPGAELEEISDRYGLGHDRVRDVAAVGGKAVAFLLEDALAVADGRRVRRYPAAGARALAAGGGTVALLYLDRVEALDVRDRQAITSRTYVLRGIIAAAVDGRGQLFVATRRAVFRSQAASLRLLHEGAAQIAWLAAAGSRVWFAEGDALLVGDEDGVALAQGGPGKPPAGAVAAADGGLWLLADSGAQRLHPDRPSAAEARWDESIRPRFARACGECHGADGKSGVDLSTAAAWLEGRDEIRERVVERRTMPPAGRSLAEDDRAAIGRWLATVGR
jgi:mono/diheme cytochrome c family protein